MAKMTDKEKRKMAREMLKRNGYDNKEIADILRRAFGDEDARNA
jgi:SOS response regulatory protein OraA/RecX